MKKLFYHHLFMPFDSVPPDPCFVESLYPLIVQIKAITFNNVQYFKKFPPSQGTVE